MSILPRSYVRLPLCLASTLLLISTLPVSLAAQPARAPREIAWSVRYDPRTFDPAKVDDQVSELIRYLTGGVLLRVNRQTQQVEPELAQSYSVRADGRALTFHLRPGLRFSDGTPLTSRDVAFSLRRVLDPATGAPAAEDFLKPQEVRIDTPDAATVQVTLPQRVIGIANVFDEIAIEPADRPSAARVTAGPYVLAEAKPGQSVRLTRNPNYWKHDPSGAALPYSASLRLDVLSNREQELTRFARGDYDLIDALPPDAFALLDRRAPGTAHDLGASLNTEQLWFNQSPAAPMLAYEHAWFQSRAFRVAVSEAIHRDDLARIAYDGHATPARGFVSPNNTIWADKSLQITDESVFEAQKLLASEGFHKNGAQLVDREGHPVRFSLLTNAGNAARGKMATLIQQDLAALGMEVTLVTLDFPALIERLTKSQNYEACLLGHPNVDPDPNSMMNEWLSNSPNHQWNPSEETPATPWEAEIDAAMRTQATSLRFEDRKRAFDRVQQIVADQQPYIYLVHPNVLYAVSPKLEGVAPTVFQPNLVWNIDRLRRR